MWRNYLAAALRNLARNRLYAAASILSLTLGFAAALLIGLYVRDELTYDRFVPGHERVYTVSQTIGLGESAPIRTASTPAMLAKLLAADFPQIEHVARLSGSRPKTVRRGDVKALERDVAWADPEVFRVLTLPLVAGDLAGALDAPDEVVITRAVARKYFGRDAPVSETLLVENRPVRVAAVLRDLPSNTHLRAGILLSSRSPESPMMQFATSGTLSNVCITYFRLRPGAAVSGVQRRLASFAAARMPLDPALGRTATRTYHLLPLKDVHFSVFWGGDVTPVAAVGAAGALIVLVAAINFVTLMTARAARRAVEVGVRKAAGATRRDLIAQFLAEALGHVLAAAVLAVSIAELLLPAVNALLRRRMAFDYWSNPGLVAAAAGVLALTGLLAGAYPALVLSRFRPSAVLKGGPIAAVGGGLVRRVLVVAQFAILVALALGVITIARQTLYALNEGMRVDSDQVLHVATQPCSEAMRDEVRRLPGVRAAACAFGVSMSFNDLRDVVVADGRRADIASASVDFGFFEVFGVKPLAGRLFDRARPGDGVRDTAATYQPLILNATAVRRLGFASPQAAIGKFVVWHGEQGDPGRRGAPPAAKPSQVIGVVPDFTLGSIDKPVSATLYAIGSPRSFWSVGLVAKLNGRQVPETLAAIDRLWDRLGDGGSMQRTFIDQRMLEIHRTTIQQGAAIAAAAVVAVAVAVLGLFALSAYTTERRTKEIGVRKALGAGSPDVLRLLIWQFTVPVLIANLIAAPVAWIVMRRWLEGFAYHVALTPWPFAAVAAGSVLIAWATVAAHAFRVARAKPVHALRYE